MEKHRKTVNVISFCIAFALILAFAVWLILSLPIYSDFSKEVPSYQEMRKALEDRKGICFSKEGTPELLNAKYFLQLDGRGRFADPVGYSYGGTVAKSTVSVTYSITCSTSTTAAGSSTHSYRDIPLSYSTYASSDREKQNTFFEIWCCLDGNTYCASVNYQSTSMEQNEIVSYNKELEPFLLEALHQIIDEYYIAIP